MISKTICSTGGEQVPEQVLGGFRLQLVRVAVRDIRKPGLFGEERQPLYSLLLNANLQAVLQRGSSDIRDIREIFA